MNKRLQAVFIGAIGGMVGGPAVFNCLLVLMRAPISFVNWLNDTTNNSLGMASFVVFLLSMSMVGALLALAAFFTIVSLARLEEKEVLSTEQYEMLLAGLVGGIPGGSIGFNLNWIQTEDWLTCFLTAGLIGMIGGATLALWSSNNPGNALKGVIVTIVIALVPLFGCESTAGIVATILLLNLLSKRNK